MFVFNACILPDVNFQVLFEDLDEVEWSFGLTELGEQIKLTRQVPLHDSRELQILALRGVLFERELTEVALGLGLLFSSKLLEQNVQLFASLVFLAYSVAVSVGNLT